MRRNPETHTLERMIRRRVTGNGEVRYDVELRRPDRRVYGKTFQRKKDAEAWERDQLRRRDRGEWLDPNAGKVTLDRVIDEWLTVPGRRPKTIESYQYRCKRIRAALGSRQVASITPADVKRFVAQLSAEWLSASTVAGHYATLRAVLAYAVDAEMIASSPCRNVTLPKLPTETGRPLEPDEVQALAAAMHSRYRPLVWVSVTLSLRMGELAGLQVGDVDVDAGTVAVQRGVSWVDGHPVVGEPKTSAGVRTVAMPAWLGELLERHIAGLDDQRSDAWLFPMPGGGVLHPGNWRRRFWRPAVDRAGLHGVVPHDLRRTSATLMVSAGVDPKTVQRRMGHSDMRMTLGLYARARAESDRAAADAVGGMFDGWRDSGGMDPDPKDAE